MYIIKFVHTDLYKINVTLSATWRGHLICEMWPNVSGAEKEVVEGKIMRIANLCPTVTGSSTLLIYNLGPFEVLTFHQQVPALGC